MKLHIPQRLNLLIAFAVCTASVLVLATSAVAQTAELVGLGFLDDRYPTSSAHDVSADGAVVCGKSAREGLIASESFWWTRATGLVGSGLIYTNAEGVSGDGRFVVGYANPPREAYRWNLDTDAIEYLGDLDGGEHESLGLGTNFDGAVAVGYSYSGRARYLEAFRWTAEGGMIGLGDMDGGNFYSYASDVSADSRIIVGEGRSYDGDEAFLWTESDGFLGLGHPKGWRGTEAHGISPDGSVVVGRGTVIDRGTEGFKWTHADGVIPLGVLDEQPFEYFGDAQDSSALGWVIVGSSNLDDVGTLAVAWTPQKGILILNQLLEEEFDVDLDDWSLQYAYGVSYDGKTIVGQGRRLDSDGREAFLIRVPCIDDCDRCSFTERMKAQCAADGQGTVTVTAKLRSAKPGASLTFCLDYYKAFKTKTVKPSGRAKARFKELAPVPPLGNYHVTLKECDAPADARCSD